MSVERATYLDASALVKLVDVEPETPATRRGREVLLSIELIRVTDRILTAAGELLPMEIRTLDAIHLATARELGSDLARLVTYHERMSTAATALGMAVAAPA